MKIGLKIKKLRELKGLSQENMAEELHMSVTGYGKIERDEVSINLEKLAAISQVLGLSVEDLLSFNEQIVFNNFSNDVKQQYAKEVNQYYMPAEVTQLYQDKVALLQDKIQYLEKELNRLGTENDTLRQKHG